MKTILLCAGIFSLSASIAQSLRYPVAKPYISLSAYSKEQNDVLSFTGNQASLAQTEHAGAGLFGERRFMLKETSAYTLGAAFPTKLGNFGIQLNYSGYQGFNEYKAGLAYARRLGKAMNVGVQFNYYGYRIPVYGNASTMNFEVGMMMHLTDKLNAGLHVYNPVSSTSASLKIASVYKAGLGYDATEQFFIAAEVIKEEDKTVNVITGIQYHFAKQFFLRMGLMSESAAFYAGAGIGWKSLRLDISCSHHPQLGFSPAVLLIMDIKKKDR
jgi:hypothetical protein